MTASPPRADQETAITERVLSAKIEAMAGYGLSASDIALVLGLDEESLTADYATELATGSIKANARVAESLFRKATGEGRESVTAAIFWLKTRARWSEASVHLHEGKVDNTIMFVTTYEDRGVL